MMYKLNSLNTRGPSQLSHSLSPKGDHLFLKSITPSPINSPLVSNSDMDLNSFLRAVKDPPSLGAGFEFPLGGRGLLPILHRLYLHLKMEMHNIKGIKCSPATTFEFFFI